MEIIKKYWQYFVILILVLLLINNCSKTNNNDEVEIKIKQLSKQLKISTDSLLKFREKQTVLFDSIFLAEKIKNKKIVELKNLNNSLEKQLKISKEKLKQKKESFKNKTYQQLAEIFKQNGYKNVTATNNSVNLEKDTPEEILDNLAEGDNRLLDLQIKDSIIKNKDFEISLVNEKVLDKDLQLASKQIEIEQLDNSFKISREINKKQEDENKKLKRKNFITTYIVPPLVFLAGIFIAK